VAVLDGVSPSSEMVCCAFVLRRWVGASISTERKLCPALAMAGNVDTLGADYLPEGVVVVNLCRSPWSFGGSAPWHRLDRLVASSCGGALGLGVGCVLLLLGRSVLVMFCVNCVLYRLVAS
jgi:hypothetical protein